MAIGVLMSILLMELKYGSMVDLMISGEDVDGTSSVAK